MFICFYIMELMREFTVEMLDGVGRCRDTTAIYFHRTPNRSNGKFTCFNKVSDIFLLHVSGTQSVKAVEDFGSNRLLSLLKPADPSSTARAIIEAGATRSRHLYFPWIETRVVTALYTFFPETVSAGFRFIWRSMGLKG